mgnify:CR=1 FL=1|jgi:predicted  nucleic acid-binding Zn-ribbon protein
MKVTEAERESLVELAELEMQLQKLTASKSKLQSSDPAEQANAEFLEVSEKLTASRAEQEDLQLEASRIGEDLELVESRMLRDQSLIQQSSNSSEITGLQHEVETLNKRKGELETDLLEKMEQQESLTAVIGQLTAQKQDLRDQLEMVEKTHDQQLLEATNQLNDLIARRNQLLQTLSEETSADYQRKASRGVPVGLLREGACTACHLNLTATDLSAIRSTEIDELVHCPECQAILIR